MLVVLVSSCKVTDNATNTDIVCNLEDYKNIEIEFGYITTKNHSNHYLLKNNLITNSSNNDTIRLESKKACNLFDKTTKLFLKIQTLNVPADSNNYIIYYNKKDNVLLRALWNPIHNNIGNEAFKSLFQEFMDITNSKDTNE